jgi:outer membrane receptor protein involved in Fe transport
MHIDLPRVRPILPWIALLILAPTAFTSALRGQSAPSAPPVTPSTAQGEVVTLSQFEVAASAADTYQAMNTNSITGTNTALGKTPLDAKVFNRQLMDELGVVDMTEMLSKLGGLGAAIIAGGNEEVRGDLEGDRQDPKSMTMRGLTINNPRRDGFLRADTALMDSFDVERVDALGGSNSLLFGSGDAGGVISDQFQARHYRPGTGRDDFRDGRFGGEPPLHAGYGCGLQAMGVPSQRGPWRHEVFPPRQPAAQRRPATRNHHPALEASGDPGRVAAPHSQHHLSELGHGARSAHVAAAHG